MAQEKFTSQDVQQVVFVELHLILEEQGKPPHPISLDDGLDADLGLSSSDLVRLVSNLTAKLGTDPFKQSASITDMRTVGDLCRLYQTLRAGGAGGTSIDTLLARRTRTVGKSEGTA